MWESYLTGVSGVWRHHHGDWGRRTLTCWGLAVRREYHWWSAGLCMSADVVLLTAGMFGASAFLLTMPSAMEAMRWVGVLFLSWLAAQALWRAVSGREGLKVNGVKARSLRSVLLATLAVTVLNPQVYLDTLLLIPAIGAQQESAGVFVAGASTASILWFSLLAWGGAALSPWLSRPGAWRTIDGLIGLMMAAIAVHLAFDSVLF